MNKTVISKRMKNFFSETVNIHSVTGYKMYHMSHKLCGTVCICTAQGSFTVFIGDRAAA